MSQLGQNRKSSTRANVFCSSLNNGHQAHGYVRLVPIGGLVAFDRSGFSALETAVWGQALSDYPPSQCRCRSRARASLRNRHQGPSIWNSKTGWNNLYRGLVRRATGPSGHTNSPHPSSREGHLSTAWWNSSFLLSHLVTCVPHATAASRVHRNSVPSTQMRCMITANRRASATIAFFIPRCLAIFMAQALSHDHFD